MQTTLDVDPVLRLWFLECEFQTPQFRTRMAAAGWEHEPMRPGLWVRRATPASAVAIRRLLGKGLLVTQAASDWYRRATT